MKSFAAIMLLLAAIATAGASQGIHQTGAALHELGLARSSLAGTESAVAVHHAHGRRLLVDTRGSDPIGADTVGNGKGASVAAAVPYTAAAPTAVPLAFPAAVSYGASAPVSAPFGQGAPSVLGRRLLVDYKGSDPVGADTKGNGAGSSLGVASESQYANAVFKTAPAASPTAAPMAAGGPVPLSTILYSSVPTAGKYTLASAPTTAPGALAAPSLGGRRRMA
ncbi:hypothetical protein COCSUDRAFT_54090 [Coccomyxa subellipsoidea C-169]|uniref:Uncharacterized protein n=1 Tax=Coccomyxa subellipsoidea (strain C-169) TaxID=574566 RepID=I0YRJ1_COCSC|nr:hypothetical protein COCSUDRAFT_54090 [Coccomyxa subellipsoidea C-169]EIE21010.1 hypothetical protein COCSUDRAFT_54090 [Coccomyxa subellipsoidea C-169]|eukprot:XP_005645554.1 hypothetical protein COCSUDRAFT_54090 [Coccomyxa subellipsoidea C-169]